ncbi:heterokaryon incompatibility protein-domain-containing protein [Sordaria sp. MPI-SDFR-AT-0083]|nr:heterokaryon incompatibility protein-domain-containing protein [Sordaria sp. MPI-SDFR-AT-0083]
METKPTAPYMTVTHRWGFDDEKMVLNKGTYAALIGGLPISSMPKLFQEAMTVALHLDVNYIWIDALCILHDKDDQTDWRHEASQMQKVYSYSFCNISALDATSCSDTLFSQPRNAKEELLPHIIHLKVVSDPLSSSGIAKPESFTLSVSDISIWQKHVSTALVNTRAWVLQERVLAPRILHFGRRQLFWECRSSQTCEASSSRHLPPKLLDKTVKSMTAGLTRFLYSRPYPQ